MLFNKIANLFTEQKLQIEEIIDTILNSEEVSGMENIDTISKILYFIDLAFIKMIAPDYVEEIMTYS